jgi:two-component system sensor histidine kinase DesK
MLAYDGRFIIWPTQARLRATMSNRPQHNVIGLIGLAGCLCSGIIDVAERWFKGGTPHSPLGQMAEAAASMFTPAPSLLRAGSDRDALGATLFLGAYVVLVLLFALLFWRRTATSARRSERAGNAMLVLQMAIALLHPRALLYLMAAELGMVFALRRGLLWLATQQLLLMLMVLVPLIGNDIVRSDVLLKFELLELGMMAVWQAIAFGIGYMAASERRGRLALDAANAELHATQLLLLDTVRATERMRIARDLHDIVGHHLTALHLHLDLALRQQGEQAPAALQTARTLAQSLLSQVRTVVGAERGAQRIALREALAALCSGIPAPRIALAVEEGLEIESAALAHALFCCVQEAISNAVRHAGAGVLTIALARRGDLIALSIGDDGRGNGGAPEGNGLSGMRERLAALGGSLRAANLPQRGFGLDISVPCAGSAA